MQSFRGFQRGPRGQGNQVSLPLSPTTRFSLVGPTLPRVPLSLSPLEVVDVVEQTSPPKGGLMEEEEKEEQWPLTKLRTTLESCLVSKSRTELVSIAVNPKRRERR